MQPTPIPEAPASNRLFTADDVAQRWGISKAAVYRFVRENRIPAVRIGKAVRFHPRSIDEFERAGGIERGGIERDAA